MHTRLATIANLTELLQRHTSPPESPTRRPGAENQYVVFHDSSVLLFALNRTLLARHLDVVVVQAENGTENLFGVFSEERRAPNLRR